MVTEQSKYNPIDNIPIEKRHTWKSGESGNPGGRPRYKPITDKLRELLDADAGNGRTNAEAIALAFIELLKQPGGRGYAAQIRELLDRTEGAVKGEVEVTEIQKIEFVPAKEKEDV